MSLEFYKDSDLTEKVTRENRDIARDSIAEDASSISLTEELYLGSDNPGITYTNVQITGYYGNYPEADVEYSTDGSTFSATLSLSDGDYNSGMKIWRKITIYTSDVSYGVVKMGVGEITRNRAFDYFTQLGWRHQITAYKYEK